MEVLTEILDLRSARAALPEPVGLVPTMGYLHEGHLSLVRCARAACQTVVVSIFVNPTQFGPSEDLASYPRDIPRDLDLLEAEKVDLVWTPTADLLYPPDYQTFVMVEAVTQPLEGAKRPGHFRGVTTIVSKLFNVVQPNVAYFGQKDAQQAIVIRQMVRDLNFPLEIVICPTVREPDGLAMSSRNTYLKPDERKAATVLYRALLAAQTAYDRGERDAARLRQVMAELIQTEPLAHPQYLSCAHPDTLVELEGEITEVLLSMAVYIGKTRLIDNILITR